MKKVLTLILALVLAFSLIACGEQADVTDIAVLVPNADHGWTGAVMTMLKSTKQRSMAKASIPLRSSLPPTQLTRSPRSKT